MSGRFIVLEGVDGAGTTTQARLLADFLRSKGIEVVQTAEPSGGPVGVLIREALQKRLHSRSQPEIPHQFEPAAFALLFAADRLDHLDQLVLPALARGAWVVSDRYRLSSLVYQSQTVAEPEHRLPWLGQINSQALAPDLTLVLDVSHEIAEQRRALRGGPPELFETRELQVKLAHAYRRGQSLAPVDQVQVLSGEGTPTQVLERIVAALAPLWGVSA